VEHGGASEGSAVVMTGVSGYITIKAWEEIADSIASGMPAFFAS